MKDKYLLTLVGVFLMMGLLFTTAMPAHAQEGQTANPGPEPLLIYTQFPSQTIGFGEAVSVPLKLRSGTPQMVKLEVSNLPEGWNAVFRGGSQIVDAVFLNGQNEVSVDLRLEQPESVAAGKFTFVVKAIGEKEKSELPLSFTIKEKLPPRLSLAVDGLPIKRGSPTTTFTFTVNLKNEGGEDLVVGLSATQPENMQVTIQSSGQEVNELELPANQTKSLSIKVEPYITMPAGKYPFVVQATAGDVKAELALGVEVVGEGQLSISSSDGRLSAQAYAGRDNPLKIVLYNKGTAPLRGIELSSSEPSGWTITFDQTKIAEIPAGQSVEVTAQIRPPEKAVAGDYVVNISARPLDSKVETAEFRITVRTSTLWGLAGLALIGLAVAVVGVAVVRFGRR